MHKSVILPVSQRKSFNAEIMTDKFETESTRSDAMQPMAKQMTKPLRRVSQLKVEASDIYTTCCCSVTDSPTFTLHAMTNGKDGNAMSPIV